MSNEFGGSVQVSTVKESKEIDNTSVGKGSVSRQSTTKGGKRAIMDEFKQASAEGVCTPHRASCDVPGPSCYSRRPCVDMSNVFRSHEMPQRGSDEHMVDLLQNRVFVLQRGPMILVTNCEVQ